MWLKSSPPHQPALPPGKSWSLRSNLSDAFLKSSAFFNRMDVSYPKSCFGPGEKQSDRALLLRRNRRSEFLRAVAIAKTNLAKPKRALTIVFDRSSIKLVQRFSDRLEKFCPPISCLPK